MNFAKGIQGEHLGSWARRAETQALWTPSHGPACDAIAGLAGRAIRFQGPPDFGGVWPTVGKEPTNAKPPEMTQGACQHNQPLFSLFLGKFIHRQEHLVWQAAWF